MRSRRWHRSSSKAKARRTASRSSLRTRAASGSPFAGVALGNLVDHDCPAAAAEQPKRLVASGCGNPPRQALGLADAVEVFGETEHRRRVGVVGIGAAHAVAVDRLPGDVLHSVTELPPRRSSPSRAPATSSENVDAGKCFRRRSHPVTLRARGPLEVDFEAFTPHRDRSSPPDTSSSSGFVSCHPPLPLSSVNMSNLVPPSARAVAVVATLLCGAVATMHRKRCTPRRATRVDPSAISTSCDLNDRCDFGAATPDDVTVSNIATGLVESGPVRDHDRMCGMARRRSSSPVRTS